MNRTQRIVTGAVSAFLLLAIVTTGAVFARGAVRPSGSPVPAAAPGRATPATPSADPFLGIADPAAPYDLRFLDEMIRHHEGAIVSAQGMIAPSSHPELRDLAQRIVTTQQQQVAQLRAWRQRWYPNAPPWRWIWAA